MHYYTKQIEQHFEVLPWNEVYDFVEFVLDGLSDHQAKILSEKLNKAFFEEGAQYKIVNNKVVKLMSESEVNEVEKASKVTNAGEHILKAVARFNKRPEPDYEGTITESINAVESLVREITGEQSGTLGSLMDKVETHPALKEGIKKIYGWTSDDSGLRHSIKAGVSKDYEQEGRFSLVLCAALVNYLKNININKQN